MNKIEVRGMVYNVFIMILTKTLLTAKGYKKELRQYAKPEKVGILSSFFKTGKGEYAEGDIFIGVNVPDSRKLAKKYIDMPLAEVALLLQDPIHECRLGALHMLVMRVEGLYTKKLSAKNKTGQTEVQDKSQIKQRVETEKKHKEILDIYLAHIQYINNWDLVDTSAHYILGRYLYEYKTKQIYSYLKKMAISEHLWTKRISIIATFYGIKKSQLGPTFDIAELLLKDKHDLIHKAVGWMLREAGKMDVQRLYAFVDAHHRVMPRTMLRYALEKIPTNIREKYMKK